MSEQEGMAEEATVPEDENKPVTQAQLYQILGRMKNMEESNKKHEQRMEDLQRENEHKIEDMQRNHAQNMEDMVRKHRHEMEDLTKEHKEEIDDLNKKYTQLMGKERRCVELEVECGAWEQAVKKTFWLNRHFIKKRYKKYKQETEERGARSNETVDT